MAASARHDAWASGEHYDGYMGRWSRPVARRFVDWLGSPPGLSWLEVGCGTGALTEAIVHGADPADVLALDPSESFLARARERIGDPRVTFRTGDAAAVAALPARGRDVAVSGLVLNFVPDREAALRAMARAIRSGGTVAFYVWDYPGGGLGFLRAFWTAATELDPAAGELTEDRRFPFCTRDALLALVREAGLSGAELVAIEEPSVFRDFDDFWSPFTRGTGPAPGYCSSLPAAARERLADRLRERLPRAADGSITLMTRAFAVRATVP